MVYATAGIAILSFVVWAHHMYTVGMPVAGELFFMYATMLIAVPTGVKVFNWVTTMWRGAMTFETPMLFSIGFLVLFTIGGFTGLMLAIAPADFQYHDTYFVVAHFHYVMVAGAVFSMTAAVYFWLPKWTGRMYNETMGKVHFWVSFIGFNVTFFPQHFVGLAGMPRRIPDYALQFADFNMMSSIVERILQRKMIAVAPIDVSKTGMMLLNNAFALVLALATLALTLFLRMECKMRPICGADRVSTLGIP